jgi:hypothetical protein
LDKEFYNISKQAFKIDNYRDIDPPKLRANDVEYTFGTEFVSVNLGGSGNVFDFENKTNR